MKIEYTCLLRLLGDFLLEREPKAEQDLNWQELLSLAQIHSVAGILGYMSMRYPICPDEKMRSQLRQLCLATIGKFTQRAAQTQAMTELLSREGIAHIRMKGAVLRNFYPVPELRTFSDVDLVIRSEDRDRCHKLLLSQGFQVETDWEPVFSYRRGEEYYEIHRQIMEVDVSSKADYRGYFEKMWEHTQEKEGTALEFTPEFHLLYLLTHIAKHIRSAGAGVRMYLDIAAFLHHYGDTLDWQWIAGELKQLALFDFACTVFSSVEDWFGVVRPEGYPKADASTLEHFLEFTMEAGVFGHHRREDGINALKREESGSRVTLLIKRAFPKAKEIESRYTYLQEKPWLLPAAWVHRLVKTRGSLSQHAREARVILTADEEQIRRLQQLTADIGL